MNQWSWAKQITISFIKEVVNNWVNLVPTSKTVIVDKKVWKVNVQSKIIRSLTINLNLRIVSKQKITSRRSSRSCQVRKRSFWLFWQNFSRVVPSSWASCSPIRHFGWPEQPEQPDRPLPPEFSVPRLDEFRILVVISVSSLTLRLALWHKITNAEAICRLS